MPLSVCCHHGVNRLWAAHWPQETESHVVRGEWSLQPGATATPADRSSAGLPRPESHWTCSVCYTARANCSHYLTSLLFPLFKICFLGFCPISLLGNPTPICYNASGEVAPSPSHDLRIWASSWCFTLGTQNLQFLLSIFLKCIYNTYMCILYTERDIAFSWQVLCKVNPEVPKLSLCSPPS